MEALWMGMALWRLHSGSLIQLRPSWALLLSFVHKGVPWPFVLNRTLLISAVLCSLLAMLAPRPPRVPRSVVRRKARPRREINRASRLRSSKKLCSFSEIVNSTYEVKVEDTEVQSPCPAKMSINMAESEEIQVEVTERESIDVDENAVNSNIGEDDDNEEDLDSYLYLEDLDSIDIEMVQFDGLESLTDLPVPEEAIEEVTIAITEGVPVGEANLVNKITNVVVVADASTTSLQADGKSKKLGRGFRDAPDAGLVAASKGKEKQKSEHNDRWSVRRADQLREHLGWDMSVELGDLPFSELDELLSNLFTRVTKVNGEDYPSESLMNLLGGFNRVVRRASDLRAVEGRGNILERNFNIKNHVAFPKTRLTLTAAIRKSAREGKNKKREKVETFTIAMEMAILSDLDHQITNSVGCQKRLAFYIMCRLGIRGGIELWLMMQVDLKLEVDKTGKEFIKYEERESKNNCYGINRTKEEQFRKTYKTYEEDFIRTLKQYLRHFPPNTEKPDLFLNPIINPASVVWYNRVHKMSEARCTDILKSMATIVKIDPDVFSNKSGRATLITRMAALGVPDEVGTMVTGHHTTEGYGRYDRSKHLKQEAATLVAYTPGLTFENALADVSKKFMEEQYTGTSENLCPLLDDATKEKQLALTTINRKLQEEVVLKSSSFIESTGPAMSMAENSRFRSVVSLGESSRASESVKTIGIEKKLEEWNQGFDNIDWEEELVRNPSLKRALSTVSQSQKMARWNRDYDLINWEEEITKNPSLAKALGAPSVNSTIGTSMGSNCVYSNCNFTFKIVGGKAVIEEDKENKAP